MCRGAWSSSLVTWRRDKWITPHCASLSSTYNSTVALVTADSTETSCYSRDYFLKQVQVVLYIIRCLSSNSPPHILFPSSIRLMLSSPVAGEDEVLIRDSFILDVKGLDRWPDLKKLSNFQKQVIRSFVVFRAIGRDNSILFTTTDKEVYGIGYNGQDINILGLTGQYFQCERVEHPVRVEDLSGKEIKEISVGDYVGGAIDGEGSLYWWGDCDGEGGEILPPHPAIKNPTVKLISIASGSRHVAGISRDHKVYVWEKHCIKGRRLSVYQHIIKITSGKTHVAMLSSEGDVYTWGCHDTSQTASDLLVDDNENYVIRKLQFNQICKDIACGFSTTLCLSSSGCVWASGGNSKSWGLTGEGTQLTKVEKLKLNCKVTKLMTGWGHANGSYQSMYIAIATDGQKQVWYDSDGPCFMDSSPTIDLFFETITPRDIMFTVLHPHPSQYCIKCVNCQSSYQIKFVADQMQRKVDVITDIIAEIVRDLRQAEAEKGSKLETKMVEAAVTKLNSISAIVADTNSVATQTEIIHKTSVT